MIKIDNTINTANILVESKKYNQAIELYKEAVKDSERDEQKIDLYNTIGRLYLNLKDINNAITYFELSLATHNALKKDKANTIIINKATVLNNLGVLVVKNNPKKAMVFHKEALAIFENVSPEEIDLYNIHIANTHYSYADAAFAKGDYYMAKKQYKAAIEKYTEIGISIATEPFIANAHYNLGNVYTDENAVYDARSNYLRALKIFRKLSEGNPSAFNSLVAATYNNLAVTAKTMYQYGDAITYYENSLKVYEQLIAENRDAYLPFYAATLNSTAIIYSEQHEVKDDYDSFGLTGFSGFGTLSTDNSIGSIEKKAQLEDYRKSKALEYYTQAIKIYNELAVNQPELYTHYLATSLHNLGVLYDSKGDFKLAEENFEKALKIRRNLAEQQPESFNLDVCVTLFNIVTMYQNLLEQTVNLDFKVESLKILAEIKTRMKGYEDDKRPVVQSMFSDYKYFLDYFNTINLEYLDVFDAIVKENAVLEKINETFDPKEKLKMQKHVVNLYYLLKEKYPNNPRLKEVLLNAYVKYSWFALRSNELPLAELSIKSGYKINNDNLNLKANEAHLFLLKKDVKKAINIYKSLYGKVNEENKSFSNVIAEDLSTLERDGLLTKELISTLI